MKKLWNYIDSKNISVARKYKMAAAILILGFAATGFCLWAIIQIWALSTPGWLFCFVFYPVIAAILVAFIYSYGHSFHSNR